MDWGGNVRLLDREVDSVPGLSTLEIEDILLDRIPQASEVVVLGVRGEPSVPIVSLEPGCELDEEMWGAVSADLPRLAQPKQVAWDDIPRTGTWKVRRLALRQQVLGEAVTSGSGRWT